MINNVTPDQAQAAKSWFNRRISSDQIAAGAWPPEVETIRALLEAAAKQPEPEGGADESAVWLDDCAEGMEEEGLDRENNARHFRAGAKAIREVSRLRPAACPPGFVLVPVEPTEEMFVAFAETWFSKKRCIDDCEMEDCYRAMIAARPAAHDKKGG